MNFHITLKSSNRKTGSIAVTTSSKETCPDVCPLYNKGCYGGGGPLAIHWRKITNGERGTDFDTFIKDLKNIKDGTIVRHNQVGDLPGQNNDIDKNKLETLDTAYQNKIAFTYTHKPVLNNQNNLEAIKSVKNLKINLSANNLDQADKLLALKIAPVTTLLKSSDTAVKTLTTPAGNRVVVCPATYRESGPGSSCKDCGNGRPLCSRDRDYIIGFPAHGYAYRQVEKVFMEV